MSALVRDLLEYSRVSHGGDERRVATDFAVLLNLALQHLQKAIDDTRAQITFDPLPTVPADQGRVLQLFQNLVGNAIKYRRPDVAPEVHVSARCKGECWEFSVADNGIGFEMRHSEQIFEPFRRLHGKGSEYEGTGIGLAICRRIMEKHGGKVWARSQPGQGSTFYFSLPLNAAAEDESARGPASSSIRATP